MHIGMLTACYLPVVNGVTQMVAQYEKHLTAAGHKVTVFTLGDPSTVAYSGRVVRSPGISLGHTGYQLTLAYSAEARRKLKHVDILHCHHPLMALEFAKRYGQGPVVFTNHTRYDLYLSSYGHMPDHLARAALTLAWRRWTRHVDAVIAPSASIRQVLLDAGVESDIEVIENGVDVDRIRQPAVRCSRAELGIPENAVVLTYVGRFSPEKNINRLVDEFCLAAAKNEGLFLLAVGGGPLQQDAVRRIVEHGFAERCKFTGHVPPDKVPALLALSDVFVSASVTEVHPLALLEAIAAGRPVVAVDSPGVSDIITDGVTGLLADRSEGSLARSMVLIAADDELRARLSDGAIRVRARFDIQNTIRRTLALYRRLIDAHQDFEASSSLASHWWNSVLARGFLAGGRNQTTLLLGRRARHG